jgi:hypothetical protein
MIEKLPMNRNSDPRLSPTCLAASSTLCLALSTATPWAVSGPSAALSLPSTASLRRLPPSTSPVLDTKVNARGSTLAPDDLAASTSTPGPTKRLRATPPTPAPARPRVGTTRATRTLALP